MAEQSVDAWQLENYDDADDALAAELGRGLASQELKLVFSGNVDEVLNGWSQDDETVVPSALWDMCEAESVVQAYALYHDAGANVALTNTWNCGPRFLQKLDVKSTSDRVCASAVHSAFSCSPAYVVGEVGFDSGLKEQEVTTEAYQLAHGLLHKGVHGLFAAGATSGQDALAIARGIKQANETLAVPRPVIFSFPYRDLPHQSKEIESLVLSLHSELPELVGFGISDVDCARVEDCLSVARLLQDSGLEVYIGFSTEHYREVELARAAAVATSAGVRMLRGEAGLPIAGTTVLAEALDI